MKRYIAVLELDDDEEIVGDANISYTYRSNGTNYGTDESVELKAEDKGQEMKTYEDGLNEAWELARKIVCRETDGGKPIKWVEDTFGSVRTDIVLRNYSASEAIKQVKEHEEIKVGDEVTNDKDWEGVVTWISPLGEYLVIILKDGTALHWDKKDFKKTGRHFSQIEEIIMQMQEGMKNGNEDN